MKGLIILTILYFAYFLYEIPFDDFNIDGRGENLFGNGFLIMKNKENPLHYLPEGYQFLDYKYKLNCSTISTFHRDIFSSKYELKAKYPIYTYIIYMNRRYGIHPLLSVCPGSHLSVPFLWSSSVTISGKFGTAVLFDSDLVHAGAFNDLGVDRYAQQYKIVHKDDLHLLNHIVGTDMTIKCKVTCNKWYHQLLKVGSLLFAYPINHIFGKHIEVSNKSFFGSLIPKLLGNDFIYKD